MHCSGLTVEKSRSAIGLVGITWHSIKIRQVYSFSDSECSMVLVQNGQLWRSIIMSFVLFICLVKRPDQ